MHNKKRSEGTIKQEGSKSGRKCVSEHQSDGLRR